MISSSFSLQKKIGRFLDVFCHEVIIKVIR